VALGVSGLRIGDCWSRPCELAPESFRAAPDSEFRAFIYGLLLEML
jgi:hypothetical protein